MVEKLDGLCVCTCEEKYTHTYSVNCMEAVNRYLLKQRHEPGMDRMMRDKRDRRISYLIFEYTFILIDKHTEDTKDLRLGTGCGSHVRLIRIDS